MSAAAVDVLATPRAIGSILFTDLVGFTAFTDAVGDAEALAVLEAQTALVEGVLAGRGDARIVKELGDGLMIWFGADCDGLATAVALRDAVAVARSTGFPLAVRMGLHRGEALARGDDLVGQAVNIASRVAGLAGPGELLVTDSVIDHAGAERARLALEPIGPVRVKGVSDPVWLHRLV